jgi:hypothetical protein
MNQHRNIGKGTSFFALNLFLLGSAMTVLPGWAATNSFPEYRRPVMTWVPPYAVTQSKARLAASFDGTGMRDALTHLGLQFWKPTKDGGLAFAGRTNEVNDAVIAELRDWGHANGVRVLLCVYNAVAGKWDWSLARAGFAENQKRANT